MKFKEVFYRNGLFVSVSVNGDYITIHIDTEDCKILHGFYKNGKIKNLYFLDEGQKFKGMEAVEKFVFEAPKAYALFKRLYEGCRSIQEFPVYKVEEELA